MKRVVVCILGIFIVLLLNSCNKVNKISTVEELYAIKSNASYELVCDLDLEGREWVPLAVKNFNGNGHTISNCKIDSVTHADYGIKSGFFSEALSVTNLILEGIDVLINEEDDDLYAGILVGDCGELRNIKIKNSSMLISKTPANDQIGGVVGNCNKLNDISIENTDIKLSFSSSSGISLSLGGICGKNSCSNDESIYKNLVLKNVKVEALRDLNYKYINIGGLLGSTYLTYTNLAVDKFDLLLPINKTNAEISIGSLFGLFSSSNLEKALVSNSSLNVSGSVGVIYLGALIGEFSGLVNNACSLNNEISFSGNYKNSAVGGFIALAETSIYSSSQVIKNSVSQKNVIKGPNSSPFIYENEISVYNCLEYSNSGYSSDNIFGSTQNLINECYTSNENNVAEKVTKIDILNAIEIMGLDESIWKLKDDYLVLEV